MQNVTCGDHQILLGLILLVLTRVETEENSTKDWADVFPGLMCRMCVNGRLYGGCVDVS